MDTLTSYNKAEELFHAAKEEMMRPEEDLVPYSICENALHAITNYLKGYLHHHGVDFDEHVQLPELLSEAVKMKKDFEQIDRTFLKHPKQTEDIWMNIDLAKDFIAITEKTRSIVGL
jgi:hypothetical protein